MRVVIGINKRVNKVDPQEPIAVFLDQLKSLSMDSSRELLMCDMSSGVKTMLEVPGITQEFFMEIVRVVSKGTESYMIQGNTLVPYR